MPATMAPPYRGLAVDPHDEAKTVDEDGRVWSDSDLAKGTLRIEVVMEKNGYDIKTTYPNEMALVADADALVARINLLMCAGQLSAANIKLIADALKATPVTAASTEAVKLNRIAAAILLVMASAEYLVQK